MYVVLRRALPAGRYVTSKGLKHSCHVVGVMEAVPYGVSTAVDAFLARLVDRRMVMVDGRVGRIRMGPAFDQWEAPNRNKPFGRSRKRSAVPSMKEP